MNKKQKIFISLLLIGLLVIIIILYLINSNYFIYNEIKSQMRIVKYGYLISNIKIINNRSRIIFKITITPDILTKKQIYELGNNLIEIIENEYEKNNSLEGIELLYIYPVSDDINENFRFWRPTSERKWSFSGNLN